MSQAKKTITRAGLTLVVLAAVLAVLWSLREDPVLANASDDGASVIATIGDSQVTKAEVEELVASGLLELERKRYELMERGLDQVVDAKLIELEAAKRGVSKEDLLATEVESKTQAVTDADVDEFYEARKDQIGRAKEQVDGQIRQFLAQQRGGESRGQFIKKLRDQYEVASFLDPLRIPVSTGSSPAKGPGNAPVTIVEFSDFECPFCSRVVPALDKIAATYGDKVRLVFRQFPLHAIHPNAQKAAEASLCARDQNKFWEMHDIMFANQRGLTVEGLKGHAAGLGLDTEAFNSCLDSDQYADEVASDLADGQKAGVTGTPALFVNGRFLSGAQPYESIAKIVDDELRRSGG